MNTPSAKAPSIKIWFTDMWPGFDFNDNYFTIYLRRYFNIKLDPKPDILIHSVYNKSHLKYKCFKVCVTGENTRPDFKESDFHIGFDFIDKPEYLRWPLFLMNKYTPQHLLIEKDVDELFHNKSRFCSFVVSNSEAKERIDFFQQLCNYKLVSSGGKYLNNIGGAVSDKFSFLKESKFNIAFENTSSPGYTTEKIFDAFLSNCVPIYWGNSRIAEDFNQDAFINLHTFKSFNEAIDYIKYLDENERAYKNMLSQPCFKNNRIPEKFEIIKFIEFFSYIFSQIQNTNPVYTPLSLLKFYSFGISKSLMKTRSSLIDFKKRYT